MRQIDLAGMYQRGAVNRLDALSMLIERFFATHQGEHYFTLCERAEKHRLPWPNPTITAAGLTLRDLEDEIECERQALMAGGGG